MFELFNEEGWDYSNEYAVDMTLCLVAMEEVVDMSHMVLCFNSFPMMLEDPSEIAWAYKKIQSVFPNKDRIYRRVFHEILSIDTEDVTDGRSDRRFWSLFAEKCGKHYYDLGFQIAYAVHWSNLMGYHIHFVGNAVSYEGGRKWKISENDIMHRQSYFHKLFLDADWTLRREAAHAFCD